MKVRIESWADLPAEARIPPEVCTHDCEYPQCRCGIEKVEWPKEKPDPINPSHYRQGGIECIDAIEAALTPEEYRGYLKGQVMKYTWRLGHKDEPAQEAGKLHWYAERLKKFLEK